jgi:pyruvate decarboxylase
MALFTVGDYLAERLAGLGIHKHFIVPGDYNLALLDRLQAHASLSQVGCTNELNCSMAAEGFARAKGIAACVVTYSVGAFSAFNGIGSAYAENLPVILISGAPNTNDVAASRLLHHTLGENDYTYQLEMARRITCYAAAIKHGLDAPCKIDEAIRATIQGQKPVYLEIPTNVATAPCAKPGPMSALTRLVSSDPLSLASAVEAAQEYIVGAQKPLILVGPRLIRSGAQDELRRFAEAMGCAVAVQPAAKGAFPEDHPQFVGIFWGQVSEPPTNAIVNWADGIVCIGTVFTDYATVGWTAFPEVPLLELDMNSVILRHTVFGGVRLKDILVALSKAVAVRSSTMVEYNRIRPDPTMMHIAGLQDALRRKDVVRQIQHLLTHDTTVFVDTGECWFSGMQLHLPRGAEFEIEMQWGHIGWSIPAAFGYAMARPDRKVVVLVGDGAFQVTAQEISLMVRYRLPITIVLFNNKGYTIEAEIHDGPYNRIKNWNYARLIEDFNSTDGQGRGYRATNLEQLIPAMKETTLHKGGPTLVECVIGEDDCSEELITWGRKVALANSRTSPG